MWAWPMEGGAAGQWRWGSQVQEKRSLITIFSFWVSRGFGVLSAFRDPTFLYFSPPLFSLYNAALSLAAPGRTHSGARTLTRGRALKHPAWRERAPESRAAWVGPSKGGCDGRRRRDPSLGGA